jgi:hypothetical protein
LLNIDRMSAAGFEKKGVIGGYFRIKCLHCLFELSALIKRLLHYRPRLISTDGVIYYIMM